MNPGRKRELWQFSVVAAIVNGKTSKQAGEVADGVLKEYAQRFGAEDAAEEAEREKWHPRVRDQEPVK